MCRRLGRKHPSYSNRNDNIRDKEGKRLRNWNETRVITRVYGHNALCAYTDLRDLFVGGEQWHEHIKQRPVKEARLERIWRCQSQQRASGSKYGLGWWHRHQSHLARNNVRVIGKKS